MEKLEDAYEQADYGVHSNRVTIRLVIKKVCKILVCKQSHLVTSEFSFQINVLLNDVEYERYISEEHCNRILQPKIERMDFLIQLGRNVLILFCFILLKAFILR